MRKRAVRLSAACIATALAWPLTVHALNDVEVADTYFNRFLKDSLVKGYEPNKFRLLYLRGTSLMAAGLGGEIRQSFGASSATVIGEASRKDEPPWLSHDIALLGYRNDVKRFDDDIRSFNASYGLALRFLPIVGSVHAGINWNWGSRETFDPEDPLEQSSIFAPYLYIDSTPYETDWDATALRPSFSLFALPTSDYRDLRKALVTLALASEYLDGGLWYERTQVTGGFLQEYSLYGHLRFGKMEQGVPPLGVRARLGNAFPDQLDVGDAFADPDRLFGVVELAGAYVVGLSYRDDLGLGFRAGLDWTVDRSLTGFNFNAQLYYARNFINDSVLGQFVDKNVVVIGVAIQ